jgi:hypothetical protein
MEKPMSNAQRIRALNDFFRQTLLGGHVVVTAWLADNPDLATILEKVRRFSDFSEDNDPHGEHDFGAFDHAGDRFFWKIDYYDLAMDHGSSNPADPAVTTRLLTIMKAEEY